MSLNKYYSLVCCYHLEIHTNEKETNIMSKDCTKILKKYAATNNLDFWNRQQRNPPALAGIVQGVVVQMAKHTSGKYSFNKPPEVGEALTNLKMAYMLLETCPSGYCT